MTDKTLDEHWAIAKSLGDCGTFYFKGAWYCTDDCSLKTVISRSEARNMEMAEGRKNA